MSVKKIDKFDLLLNSALDIFAEKGYHQTKIKDITDNASLGAGTFYLYFKNKEELIIELFKRYLDNHISISQKIHDSNKNAYSKLEEYINANVLFMYENKDFFQIFIEHIFGNESSNPIKTLKKYVDKFYELTENIIQQGQIEHFFTEDVNLAIASKSLRAMIAISTTEIFLLESNDITPQELSKNIFQLFVRGIKK